VIRYSSRSLDIMVLDDQSLGRRGIREDTFMPFSSRPLIWLLLVLLVIEFVGRYWFVFLYWVISVALCVALAV
jgi:hypothetical protein